MTPEIRLVEWVDAEGGTRWQPLADIQAVTLAECKSIGFVVAETREAVTLVQSLDPGNETADNFIVIPKTGIVRQVTLRKGRG